MPGQYQAPGETINHHHIGLHWLHWFHLVALAALFALVGWVSLVPVASLAPFVELVTYNILYIHIYMYACIHGSL